MARRRTYEDYPAEATVERQCHFAFHRCSNIVECHPDVEPICPECMEMLFGSDDDTT